MRFRRTRRSSVYEQLKAHGKVVRGWLGVSIASVNDPNESKVAESFGYTKNEGVIVQQVLPDTPSSGKLEEGDIITALNGKQVKDVHELRNQIAMTAPGKEISLSVFRDKKNKDVTVKLGEQPANLSLASRNGQGEDNADNGKTTSVGLGLTDLTDDLRDRFGIDANVKGALVREVDPKSPAAKEGIRPGDVITKVGNKSVSSADEAKDALGNADLSKGVRLYVVSKDASRFVFLQSEK